jgi:hypothetical protein
MATNTSRTIPTHSIRGDKPSKHASMWNAVAARRAELHKGNVIVTVVPSRKVTK